MKKIILTLGEPAGIGPDLGVLLSKTSLDRNIVVIADPELIRNSALKLRQKVNINTLDNIDDKTISGKGCINVLPEILQVKNAPGKLNPKNSKYVIETIRKAAQFCINGKAKAMITGPISKSVLNKGGYKISGHTEFLADICKSESVMMLMNRQMKVALHTTHLPLSKVHNYVTKGSRLMVQGRIMYGMIEDKHGNMRSTTSIVAEDVIPGTIVELTIDLESSDGAVQSTNIPIQIGVKEMDDPLGPDAYGYYAYDNGDILYSNAPYFNWIEIDPLYGGPGTQLALSDFGDNQDDVTTVNLPFTFKFYGVDYDQISVSSNGWVSMGSTDMKSFRNYPLPGPGGPSPMIAVFWDDLNTTTSGGRVYKWYDELNNQFVIQWSNLRTYDNNSLENFQLILKDSQHYFTPTGDGEILMQFADFNNTSTGNYGWGQVHGNYCTIGLEDHSETIGLEYTFNNTYPISAMPLEDSTAILFTTRGANILQRGDINQDGLLNITDVLTLVDFVQSGNTGGLNPYLADVNADEIINFLDMISIVREIMGY